MLNFTINFKVEIDKWLKNDIIVLTGENRKICKIENKRERVPVKNGSILVTYNLSFFIVWLYCLIFTFNHCSAKIINAFLYLISLF